MEIGKQQRKNRLYHFKFQMKHHSEQHLVNRLKYLKDKNA